MLHGPSGQLAPAFESADEVMVYRPGAPNIKLWSRVVATPWTACFDFTGTDRSAIMARMSRAGRTYGYRKFAARRPWRLHCYTELCDASVRELHTVDFFRALTGLKAATDSGFAIPSNRRSRVEGLPAGRFAVVHPGSTRSEKLWPAEQWAEVIAGLPLPVVLTGSADPDEQRHLDEIRQRCGIETGAGRTASRTRGKKAEVVPAHRRDADTTDEAHRRDADTTDEAHRRDADATDEAHRRDADATGADAAGTRVADLSGRLNLLQLAEVIRRARLVVSVDSAAMHLAAMEERPQVALFGPTNPFHWGPRHDQARVLLAGSGGAEWQPRHEPAPMSRLSTATVRAAIDSLLAGPAPAEEG